MELQRHIFIMNNKQLALEHKHSGMKRSEHHSGLEKLCIDQNILNYIDSNKSNIAITVTVHGFPVPSSPCLVCMRVRMCEQVSVGVCD